MLGFRPRHADGRGARHRRRWPTPSSSPSACPTCSAACSPKARSTRPSSRCLPRRIETDGHEAARAFAGQALFGLLFIGAGRVHHPRRDRDAVADAAARAGLQRTTPRSSTLTVLLARIALPYLVCMSLVALYAGVLNALGRFATAAFAPMPAQHRAHRRAARPGRHRQRRSRPCRRGARLGRRRRRRAADRRDRLRRGAVRLQRAVPAPASHARGAAAARAGCCPASSPAASRQINQLIGTIIASLPG